MSLEVVSAPKKGVVVSLEGRGAKFAHKFRFTLDVIKDDSSASRKHNDSVYRALLKRSVRSMTRWKVQRTSNHKNTPTGYVEEKKKIDSLLESIQNSDLAAAFSSILSGFMPFVHESHFSGDDKVEEEKSLDKEKDNG